MLSDSLSVFVCLSIYLSVCLSVSLLFLLLLVDLVVLAADSAVFTTVKQRFTCDWVIYIQRW